MGDGVREARPGPAPTLGLVLAPLYRMVINSRNRRFDAGRGVVRFDRVVISVGNLSVGGTGKTPMVAQIVAWLLEAGHRPVIAMRGYGGRGGDSDEALAHRRAFPEVPIVAQANRTLGLIHQFGREYEDDAAESDCIVLDDGFQHRQIARDLDIVLIDATRSPFEDRLLPAGWLREPVESLKRADVVAVTHAESVAPADVTTIERALHTVRGRGAEVVARHEWGGLAVFEDGQERDAQVAWLSGRRALVVCAIGNPRPFVEQVRRATGIPPAGDILLRDHDPYAEGTVRRILETARSSGAQAIITTEKDWTKLVRVRAQSWPCAVARPRLAMRMERGGDVLRQRILAVVAAGAPE
jgi:tetraacyldisaccharide 4'-kinase